MFLTCFDLSYKRSDNIIITDTSFTFLKGSCNIITGPNGSGKTTLLNLIVGLLQKNSGEILWFDDINAHNELQDFMYLGHKNGLLDKLTVAEHLKSWVYSKIGALSVEAAINYFNLEEILNVRCKDLSAGTKKRLALSRFLIQQSKVWVLDEPFANLDEKNKDLALNMIQSKCQSGGIVIFSSNDNIKVNGSQNIDILSFK